MSAFKEVRFDVAPDSSLNIIATPHDGEAQHLTIPAAEITGFVAHALTAAAQAGRTDPNAGSDLPPESQSIVVYPLRVGLSNALDHPTIVVDFGGAKINLGVDVPSLRHLLGRLNSLYPA
jgi:hypothetical protein